MIYETAFVLRAEANEEAIKKAKSIVEDTVKKMEGEILVNDDWGVKTFAQATSNGVQKGQYFYFIFKGISEINPEIERLFKISEDVLKFIVVKLGEDEQVDEIAKAYKSPNHAAKTENGMDEEKEKRMFQKKKSCYFSAKKTTPDWKNPASYAWLVNEFGKISPARVTGLRPKFQRMATTAIKRGRCMGMISYMSNHVAR